MFNEQSGIGEPSNFDPIPNGTLCKGLLTVKSIEKNRNGGSRLELEITITDGPYTRRKIWDNIGNALDPENSEDYRKFATRDLTRILEAAGVFIPGNRESYETLNAFANKSGVESAQAIASQIDSTDVRFRVKVEKGGQKDDGTQFPDRNRVSEWFSPNPASNGFAGWQKLDAGAPQAQGPAPVPAATAAPAPAATGLWPATA